MESSTEAQPADAQPEAQPEAAAVAAAAEAADEQPAQQPPPKRRRNAIYLPKGCDEEKKIREIGVTHLLNAVVSESLEGVSLGVPARDDSGRDSASPNSVPLPEPPSGAADDSAVASASPPQAPRDESLQPRLSEG